MDLVRPGSLPPLDPAFRPAVLANHRFQQGLETCGLAVPMALAFERMDGAVSRYETAVYPEGHPRFGENLEYVERLVKFLLWQRGGWRLFVGGPAPIVRHLQACYSPQGRRAFETHFMGAEVYQRPFTVVRCAAADVPRANESRRALGQHLDGCRIGFDLGASDMKVSAVVEGETVFSQEIDWDPREQTDPGYHREKIRAALQLAASKMPRLDAVGGSSAGVYIQNRPMVASLFRGVPKERFAEVRQMFVQLRAELGVPLEVINDGEVTALAGSMSLGDTGVLGLALGSSLAAGYVTRSGMLTDWLNELAFAPIDYAPEAPLDEWSGDRGCGAQYLSQQCVFRLAAGAGVEIPEGLPATRRLEVVQEQLGRGHAGARRIWETIGIYMGYTIAHCADFYDLKHVLILGRCTSGAGGSLILEGAGAVLRAEFPELASRIALHLPDEGTRRVGQAVAAASLPALAEDGR
jgi:predicted NBD/HSP70 family sugar kinase